MADSFRSRFFSGTVFTSFGRLFTVFLGFGGLLISSRILSKPELGNFLLIQTIVQLLVGLSDLGINTALVHILASENDATYKQRVINTAVVFRIGLFLLFLIIFLMARDVLLGLYGQTLYTDLIIFIPLMFFVYYTESFLLAIFQGSFRFRFMGLVEIITSTTSFVLIILLVGVFKLGVVGRVYAYVVSGCAGLLTTIFLSKIRFKLVWDFQIIKRMLIFGFPLYVNYLLTFVFQKADTLIIGALLGSAEIALYEIARKIPESMDMFYTAFRQVYFPFFAKLRAEGGEQANQLLNQSNRIIAFLGFWGVLASIVFGKFIIITLFSDKYMGSVPVFSLLMIGLTVNLIDYTLGYTLVAVGDTNKPPIINTFHTAISLAGYLLLIPRIGFIGAALSSILGTIVVNPVYVYFLRKKDVNAQFSPYIVPLLIFIGFAIPTTLLPPETFLMKLLVLILYIIVGFIMNIVTISDIMVLFNEGKKFVSDNFGRVRSQLFGLRQ